MDWRGWLDERSGYRGWLQARADEPMPGGPRWGRGFGVVLAALFALEAVTGIGLGAFYSPSSTAAWASVFYIQRHVALGWMLRGLHHYGAHAFMIVLVLHLFRVVWTGAFRSPRELNWIIGLLLLGVLLGLSHTGFLLPGDQRAYFATQIMLGIAASVPAIGEKGQVLLQGGGQVGNLTLTRLYALHALLLPAVFVAVYAVHARLVRRNGRAGSNGEARYFPDQFVRDAALVAVAIVLIAAVVIARHGAPFDAPADPSQQYPGRPEWYFYPLFQLRKLMEGRLEWVATLVIPGIAAGVLFLFPWIDRRLVARGRDGLKILSSLTALGLVAIGALGLVPAVRDLRDAHFQQMRLEADRQAELADRLAERGVPVEGATFLYRNDPVVWGERVFAQKCATCHLRCALSQLGDAEAQQKFKGSPCLDGYASREWLTRLLQEPHNAFFFGNTKIDEMDPFSASTDRLRAVVEFLYAQAKRPDVDTALAAAGEKLYEREGCDSCHSLDKKGTGLAPDLAGYASEEWLSAFIRTPDATRFYEKKNEMDDFDASKLDAGELRAVVAYLNSRAAPP